MIEFVKDLSSLNPEDLLVRQDTIKKESIVILTDDASEEARRAAGERVLFTIIAKGSKVDQFEVGDIVASLKSTSHIPVALINPEDKNSSAVLVVSAYNVAFTVKPENYELPTTK